MMSTYYVIEWRIGALEIPKMVVLYLHKEMHKYKGKFAQTQSVKLQKLLVLPYIPFISIFGNDRGFPKSCSFCGFPLYSKNTLKH